MPPTDVLIYQEDEDDVPLTAWMKSLRLKSQIKIAEKIRVLGQLGHEARRPIADILRDKIYELRASDNDLQLRVLYFFHDNKAIILSHGILKNTDAVPDIEIERAIERRKKFLKDPDRHTFKEE